MPLLLVALGACLGLGLLWLATRARPERTPKAPLPIADAPPAERPRAELPQAEGVPAEAPRDPGPGELEPFRTARSEAVRFEGRTGSVRGHVEVSGEEPFPTSWRLVARPSQVLPAREFAVERRLEVTDGRQDFELADLPLGGYDLQAEAEGFNGQVLPLLLEQGAEHPFVNLRMVPAGTLEGRVLDALGAPAEDVPLTLFAVSDNAAREVRSDVHGRFRFEKLADGAYELLVGAATAPLIPERRPVRVQAPRLTFPDIELPPLGEIHVRVVDSLERPIEGVLVRGSGTNGGLVDGRTDALGWLLARHLPAGHYRLRLEHPGYDARYARRIAVDVQVGEVTQAPVLYGP